VTFRLWKFDVGINSYLLIQKCLTMQVCIFKQVDLIMIKTLPKIFLVLSFILCSGAYGDSCWQFDLNDCRVKAEQGHLDAVYNLGVIYYTGQGVSRDYKEAVRWYQKSAARGHSRALYNLGLMSVQGQGVSQDHQEAVRLFKKSAEYGYTPAKNNLGVMYYNGEGVPQDYRVALRWFSKAAGEGDVDAPFHLSEMYRLGKGVIKDYGLAYMYATIALLKGNINASQEREILSQFLTVPERKVAQDLAEHWLRKHENI